MKREKRRTIGQLLELLPCTGAYWNIDAQRLSDAARAGKCKMEIIGYPYWRFTKNDAEPKQRMIRSLAKWEKRVKPLREAVKRSTNITAEDLRIIVK